MKTEMITNFKITRLIIIAITAYCQFLSGLGQGVELEVELELELHELQ